MSKAEEFSKIQKKAKEYFIADKEELLSTAREAWTEFHSEKWLAIIRAIPAKEEVFKTELSGAWTYIVLLKLIAQRYPKIFEGVCRLLGEHSQEIEEIQFKHTVGIDA